MSTDSRRRCLRHGTIAAAFIAVIVAAGASHAVVLDFHAALQGLDAGVIVDRIETPSGGWVLITAESNGPDFCVVFDSANPGDTDDLGSPHGDFGGPGNGDGGAAGAPGENGSPLGKILILVDDDDPIEDDDDEVIDDLEDSEGTLRFEFSHPGYLSFAHIDADEDEPGPTFRLYRSGALVATVQGEGLGDNAVQHFDFTAHGEVDACEVEMEGGGIAHLQIEVVNVAVEATSWSDVKGRFGR